MIGADVSRRNFLRTSAATAGAALLAPAALATAEPATALPKRKLGKSGVEVCPLAQGTADGATARHLDEVYAQGIRYIDTADCYANGAAEASIAEWFAASGKRKEFFLVTKDHPRSGEPDEWVKLVDTRLEALKIDQIDLFFIHALGEPGKFPGEKCKDWPASSAWAKAAEKMKKAGKIRLAGFSTHYDPIDLRCEFLRQAAKGGWVDAIMLAANPTVIRDNAEFNKALDACHDAGIGLICMKSLRGGLDTIKNVFPKFEQKHLTPAGAVLSAIWSDERFSAICCQMNNLDEVRQNAETARNFRPLSKDDLSLVHELLDLGRASVCVGCDHRCQRAAGTPTAFADIARYLSYCRHDGARAKARALFAALSPEQRDWANADLDAAADVCLAGIDWPGLLARARFVLAARPADSRRGSQFAAPQVIA